MVLPPRGGAVAEGLVVEAGATRCGGS